MENVENEEMKEENCEMFRDRLTYALKQSGMSYSELSKRSGVSKSSLSKYARGVCLPKQDVLKKIAESLGVNILWLMGIDTDIEPEYKAVNTEYELYGAIRRAVGEDAAEAFSLFIRLRPVSQGRALERLKILSEEDAAYFRRNAGRAPESCIKEDAAGPEDAHLQQK